MQLTNIQKQMLATFLSLRVGIGVLGIVFPLLLLGGGMFYGITPQADSMSAYYHATRDCIDPHLNVAGQCGVDSQHPPLPLPPLPTGQGPMRNWFVGLLFAIGVGLYLIKGFSKQENVLLTIAGIFAVCVALFPMPWTHDKTSFSIHYASAIAFFLTIAFVVLFCSGKTLKFIPPTTPNRDKVIARYRTAYRALAFAMVAFPLTAYAIGLKGVWNAWLFVAEALGVWAFGAFWLLKTKELSLSDVERRAMRGEIDMDTSKLR
jgi:hypothetical protein